VAARSSTPQAEPIQTTQAEPIHTPRQGCVAVISPTARSNALGRAICLADLAREVFGTVHLYAPDDGAPWPGAGRSPLPLRRFAAPREVMAALRAIDGPLTIWVVKPLPASWRSVRAIKGALPTATLILDLDDDDEALSRRFRAESMLNRLRLHPFDQLHPRRIRRTLAAAVQRVDGVTYASEALRSQLGVAFTGPTLRVPHPRRRARRPATAAAQCERRPATAAVRREREGVIGLGFVGTARAHKGVADIERLVREDRRYRLHVFDGALPSATRRRIGTQLIEHDANAPLESVYAGVDVVVLPQQRSRGARVQLPAKLLDAMRLGKPIVASPTAAIVEAAADTVVYVEDWGATAQARRAIEAALADGAALGRRAQRRFEERLALETQVAGLRGFVQELSSERRPMASRSQLAAAIGE
jgi:hypothetical protein